VIRTQGYGTASLSRYDFCRGDGRLGLYRQTQTKTEAKASSVLLVKAARLLDVRSGHYIENMAILIKGDRVKEARKRRRSGGARAEDRESD